VLRVEASKTSMEMIIGVDNSNAEGANRCRADLLRALLMVMID
jgi:uncharacterized protein (DUF342 family)